MCNSACYQMVEIWVSTIYLLTAENVNIHKKYLGKESNSFKTIKKKGKLRPGTAWWALCGNPAAGQTGALALTCHCPKWG